MGFADFGSGLLSKIATGFTGANNISSPGGYKRKHPLRVSAMNYVSAGFNFVVTLNEFTFGFKSVSGISVSRTVNTQPQGGLNDYGIIVEEPSQGSYTLSFSRGLMIRYPQAIDATARSAAAIIPNSLGRKTALIACASASPQAALEKGPALGFIHVYDRTNKRLLGLYSFLSLGMTEWRVSDLDAESGSSLLIEDMTIVHTGITREPTVPQPFSLGSISGFNQESDVDRQAREAYEKIEKAKESEEYKKLKKELEKKKKMLELIKQEEDPTDADLKDFDENERKYIEDARAAKKKNEKMQKLIDQEAEPTDADLEEFKASEKNYIKRARLAKKSGKSDDEIKDEKEKIEEQIAKRQDEIEKSRKENEEARENVEEAKKEAKKAAAEKAQKIQKLIDQEAEPTDAYLEEFNENEKNYIKNSWASKKTRKSDEEIKKEKEEVKKQIAEHKGEVEKSRKESEEAREKATKANQKQDDANKERAEKIVAARKEKEKEKAGSESDSGASEK